MDRSITARILSYLGVGLGTVGLLFCLAVIVAAWWVNAPITYRLLYQVFPPVESALAFGNVKATELNDFVTDVQTQFAQVTDAKPIAAALEDEIEQVAVYVDVAYAVTDSAEQALIGVEAAAQPGRAGNIVSAVTTRLTGALAGMTGALDATQSLAQDVRAGRDEKVEQLSQELETFHSHTSAMQAAIDQTQNDVALIKSRVPRWVNLASLLATLIFVWFGAAQYFLMRAGWRFLRRSRATGDQGREKLNALNEQINSLQAQLAAFKTAINQEK